jgi:hypothetical protein
MAKSKDSDKGLPLVSYRVSEDTFEHLKKYAQTQRDDITGKELSPSQAARRILLDALKRLQQKKT